MDFFATVRWITFYQEEVYVFRAGSYQGQVNDFVQSNIVRCLILEIHLTHGPCLSVQIMMRHFDAHLLIEDRKNKTTNFKCEITAGSIIFNRQQTSILLFSLYYLAIRLVI